jgi:PhnB protein
MAYDEGTTNVTRKDPTMQSRLNPYLSFKDNTREAMTFYQSVFGGKLDMHTFQEYHASQDPSEDNKIMHAMLEADNGITFMGADTPNAMEYQPGSSISMSLSGDNMDELSGYYTKLAEGGTVVMPLEKAPWGDTFGMVADKFGVAWMVNVSPAQAEAGAAGTEA